MMITPGSSSGLMDVAVGLMASAKSNRTIANKPVSWVALLALACMSAGIVPLIWAIWSPGLEGLGQLLVWIGLFIAIASFTVDNSRKLRLYHQRIVSDANRSRFWFAYASAALVFIGILVWLVVSGRGDAAVPLIAFAAFLALTITIWAQGKRLEDCEPHLRVGKGRLQ